MTDGQINKSFHFYFNYRCDGFTNSLPFPPLFLPQLDKHPPITIIHL